MVATAINIQGVVPGAAVAVLVLVTVITFALGLLAFRRMTGL